MTVQSMRPELSEGDIVRLMKGETSEERATVAHRLCRRIAVDMLTDDEREFAVRLSASSPMTQPSLSAARFQSLCAIRRVCHVRLL